MHSDTAIATPSPLGTSMPPMVVVVTVVSVPIRTHAMPASSIPPLQDAQSVTVAATSNVAVGPEPARPAVVVVASPQMPVRTHATPMALIIAVKRAQAIQVDANSPEASPGPPVPSVQMVIVVVPTVQVPIRSDIVPSCSIEAPQNPEAVQMSSNPAITSPEPTRSLVVVVATPQMPVCAHSAPFALIVAVQGTQTVQVHTHPVIASPNPSGPAMILVVVMVASPQLPVAPHIVPSATIPALVHPLAIQMPAHTAVGVGPEPTWPFVIMVATPQVPI